MPPSNIFLSPYFCELQYNRQKGKAKTICYNLEVSKIIKIWRRKRNTKTYSFVTFQIRAIIMVGGGGDGKISKLARVVLGNRSGIHGI